MCVHLVHDLYDQSKISEMTAITDIAKSGHLPAAPEGKVTCAFEIHSLRRQVKKLQGVEQRCRLAEKQLKAFEERNRLLGDNAPLGIFTIDNQGNITGINRKMLAMLPWPSVDDGKPMKLSCCQAMIGSGLFTDIQNCIDQNQPAVCEHPFTATQGSCTHLRYHLSPIPGANNTVSGVMAIVEDYSDLKAAMEALRKSERRYRYQALRDNLTGLYNQRYLYQALGDDIRQAKRSGLPVSLLFMDLDHFKSVVDTHGHINGSRAIQKVARTIDDCLEEPAYAVAYAGDEFVVVLPGMDQHQAMQKAFAIHSRMKNTPYVLDEGIAVRLQASFGIATYPRHATDLKGLIAAADQALFAIKGAGKNGVGHFHNA
jgi:diguanylate cyclase (GGDEF)-like protein